MIKKSLFAASLILLPSGVMADELKEILTKVETLATEENFSKALEELSWAKKDLETKYNKKLGGFLPDTLGDFTAGKLETSSAMGMTQISRVYASGNNKVSVEIQGGSGAGGMGGLAALGQMAAMFGQQPGQETMRIKGRTVNHQEENGEMIVYLDGGSILTVKKQSGSIDLKDIVEAIDLDGIEKFMKGA